MNHDAEETKNLVFKWAIHEVAQGSNDKRQYGVKGKRTMTEYDTTLAPLNSKQVE